MGMNMATTKWPKRRQQSRQIGVGRTSRTTWIRSVESCPRSPAISFRRSRFPPQCKCQLCLTLVYMDSPVLHRGAVVSCGCGLGARTTSRQQAFCTHQEGSVAIVPRLVAFHSMQIVAIAGGRSSCQGQLGCDRRKWKMCEHTLSYSVA